MRSALAPIMILLVAWPASAADAPVHFAEALGPLKRPVPPCVPLRPYVERDAGGRGKVRLADPDRRWEVTMRRAEWEAGGFADRRTCIAAAPAYRDAEQQAAAFLDGELTVGMPAAFVALLLGPGKRVSTAVEPTFRWGRESTTMTGRASVGIDDLLSARGVLIRQDDDGVITGMQVWSDGSGARPRGPDRTDDDRTSYRDGLRLYESGDAQGAADLWRELAERSGDPRAAYSLGDMYARGEVVATDREEAVRWLRMAAEGMFPPAQYQLALMLLGGEGIAPDPVAAYVWLSEAAQLNNPNAKQARPRVAERLTRAELDEAERRLAERRLTVPRLERRVVPLFPRLARTARLNGTALLEAQVGADGLVYDVELLGERPEAMGFGQAAVDAVRQWRYAPATRRGEPIAVYFTVVVEFELR